MDLYTQLHKIARMLKKDRSEQKGSRGCVQIQEKYMLRWTSWHQIGYMRGNPFRNERKIKQKI
jgi:hypothetical protein